MSLCSIPAAKRDLKERGAGLAQQAVEMIAGLYAVESQMRGRAPEQRQHARQTHSLPILTQIKAWMMETAAKVSRKYAIAI